MSQSRPRIVVEDVVKIYRIGTTGIQALKGVSFSVDAGEIVSIMGPSGSGKTTLLNIIGGVDRPTAGKVYVDGIDLSTLNEEQLRLYRLKKIGYVFQFFNLIPTLTALENIVLPMVVAGIPRSKAIERAKKLLEQVGLLEKANRLPEELSGGERQRVAVAVALANDPPIILADEPTGELDIVNAEKVISLLKELARKGKIVIVSTHDPRIARMTDKIYLLEEGVIKGVFAPEKIIASEVSALEEVSIEKNLADYIKKRIEDSYRELEEIEHQYRNEEIGLEELVKKYTKVIQRIEVLREELARLGIIA